MYAGIADIADGILFTDGADLTGTRAGDAFVDADVDGDRLGRLRFESPMFGPVQGSVSYGQDDQWAITGVLGRFARRDVAPVELGRLGEGQDRRGRELRRSMLARERHRRLWPRAEPSNSRSGRP
jgi:hypothetical protein